MTKELLTENDLSDDRMFEIFKNSSCARPYWDEQGSLCVRLIDRECFVFLLGPYIRFMAVGYVRLDSWLSDLDQFAAINNINKDFCFSIRASLTDDKDVVYSFIISVSGGVSEDNVVLTAASFLTECAIADEMLKKQMSTSG